MTGTFEVGRAESHAQTALVYNRDFVLLVSGQLLSLLGDRFYQIALLWLSYKLTGSTLLMGLVSSATVLPYLMVGLPAGVLADRYDRRRLMILVDVIRGLTVLVSPALLAIGLMRIEVIMVLAFLLGCLAQFFTPAYRASIPAIVRDKQLTRANSILSMGENLAGILGPAVGGMFVVWFSETSLFVLDALSFFVSATTLVLMSFRSGGRGQTEVSGWTHIARGVTFVWNHALIRLLLVLAMIVNFLLSGILAVIPPILAKEVLRGDSSTYGFLVSAQALGMFAGSATVGYVDKLPRNRVLVSGFIGAGVTYLLVSLFPVEPVIFGLFALSGFFIAAVNVTFLSLVQSSVPQERLGITFNVIGICTSGLAPLSQSLIGFLAGYVPVTYFYLICGLILIACGVRAMLSRVIAPAVAAQDVR
ncbi:MAG: MFS transporter [Actinobacteria bacterium]|nr:MFS transporter [Actinomycetota bacterium]